MTTAELTRRSTRGTEATHDDDGARDGARQGAGGAAGTNNACQPGAVGPNGYEERLEVGAIEHLAMEVRAAGELVAGAIGAGCDAIAGALAERPKG